MSKQTIGKRNNGFNLKNIFGNLWVRVMEYLSARVFLDVRARMKTEILPGSSVLDVGCGSGILGHTFSKIFNTSIVGYDIKDQRRVPIEFVSGDGRVFPFQDNSFDIVLLFFVLHHLSVEVQEELIKEAMRVSRRQVLIGEDTPQNGFEVLSCKRHINTYPMFRKHMKESGSIRSKKEWEKFFLSLNLKIAEVAPVYCFNPRHITSRHLFVIQK